MFGDYCCTRLTGLTLVLYRATHGWKTPDGNLQFAKLAHQIYTKDLLPVIHAYGTREVVAIDITAGVWQTLWASEDFEVTYP